MINHRSALRGLRCRVSMRALSIGAIGGLLLAHQAIAQSVSAPVNLDLGSVLATGDGSGTDYSQVPGAAPYEAPSVAPLNSTQPTSVISQRAIQQQLIGSQSYADAATLSPSVSAISPNGPGLSENLGLSIRGFQDGQFNVTFDGIPIGDSNDFTHHSTSFFMDNDVGQVIVDRGPGTAETVGDATFGGTVSVRTKDPLPTATLTPYGEYGSYDTRLEGLEYDTGSISWLNGGAAIFDGEHLQSNGALSNETEERTNLFSKAVIPVGADSALTLLAMYNRVYQNPPVGATLAEINAFGRNYGYNNNPADQNDARYNNDHITTDMEYIGLTSKLGDGWKFDGKVYTYAYYHRDLNGDDTNDQFAPPDTPGVTPDEVVLTPGGRPVAGVPGQNFTNSYRSVGTIDRFENDFIVLNHPSDVKFGVWFDHQSNTRAVSEVDISDGNGPNFDPADQNGGALIDRLQHNQLYTFQPYGQIDVSPIRNLTLTAGLKYAFFRRALNAPVNQGTEIAQGYEHNYTKLLPSVEARYKFSSNLSAYAQVAEGFLAPNLNTFYTTNISTDSLKPQTTWNYQTGFAYQSQHLALGADVYLVHFTDFINSTKDVNGNKVFFNQGGVIYKGIEGEATYTFDQGVSLFANAGLNQARTTATEDQIAEVPQFTANFGVIYDKNNIYASAIDQLVGGEYDSNGGASNPRNPGAWYDPYNLVNLTAGYTFNDIAPHIKKVQMKLNFDNVTNQRQIYWSPGTTAGGSTLYFVLPGRSIFLSLSIPIGL